MAWSAALGILMNIFPNKVCACAEQCDGIVLGRECTANYNKAFFVARLAYTCLLTCTGYRQCTSIPGRQSHVLDANMLWSGIHARQGRLIQ